MNSKVSYSYLDTLSLILVFLFLFFSLCYTQQLKVKINGKKSRSLWCAKEACFMAATNPQIVTAKNKKKNFYLGALFK